MTDIGLDYSAGQIVTWNHTYLTSPIAVIACILTLSIYATVVRRRRRRI
jgi:hypothetical protein